MAKRRQTIEDGHFPAHRHEPLKFPKGFLWGAATSAHQVEGNNIHNDWWQWEQEGHIENNEVSGNACDHYRFYEDDFDIIEQLHMNAHRLSIEWSRLEPHEGYFDMDEVKHYKNVLASLKKRGIKTMVTLHHFTNPIWFAKKGGWSSRKSVKYFERYVNFCAKHFGNLVDFWITINEPMVYITQSYALGIWPPQQKNIWRAFWVFRNMAHAHRHAYRSLHYFIKDAKVGVADNIVSIYSYKRSSLFDFLFTRFSEWFWNKSFYDASQKMHDFIGMNYYFHHRVKWHAGKGILSSFIDIRQEQREASQLGWEVYPQGIFEALMGLADLNKPIYITENGIATLNDHARARFIVSYLKEVFHAISSGVDVRGYFYWSLLDNFEWEKGFYPRFGLVAVDYKTQKRTIRGSAQVYAKICQENAIPHRLLKFIGHLIPPPPDVEYKKRPHKKGRKKS